MKQSITGYKSNSKESMKFGDVSFIKKKDFSICGVYKITNLINNKCYVGSSNNIYMRWKNHYYFVINKNKRQQVIHKAILKYGINNFKIELIAICPEEYLVKLEQWFTDRENPEYSIRKIVDSNRGRKQTTEQKIKQIKAQKNLYQNEEYRTKRKQIAKLGGLKRSGLTEEIICLVKEYRSKNYPLLDIANNLNIDINIIKKILWNPGCRNQYSPSETGVPLYINHKYCIIDIYSLEIQYFCFPKEIYNKLLISIDKFDKTLRSPKSVIEGKYNICKLSDLQDRIKFYKENKPDQITGKFPGNRKGCCLSKETKLKISFSKTKIKDLDNG